MKLIPACLRLPVYSACLAALLAALPAFADDEAVRVRLELDREVLPADTADKAVLKIALDGVCPPRREERAPVNVALVIDRSGSMAGDKIAKARQAALEAVRQFGPDDLVSLVVYDSEACTLVPAQPVGNGRHLEQAIRHLGVGGNTALYDGVMHGVTEVRRYARLGYVNRVILLSDGLANVGPSSAEELGRLGSSLVGEGISVTTVGLGLGFNEDLMTRLAQRSDGNTYFVEHSGDLPRIFAAELGDVLNVVARRVVVTIDFPAGVRPLSFVGRDGTIRGQRAELTLNQLYGGQEKFALVEVEVAPARADTEREVARAEVTYERSSDQRVVQLAARRSVRFSASRPAVVASANHQVQADWARNVLAVAKDEAVALVDANRRGDAARALEARSRELETMAVTYRNPTVQALAEANTAEADRVEREGLSNARRKAYRAESTQIRSQQAAGSSYSPQP